MKSLKFGCATTIINSPYKHLSNMFVEINKNSVLTRFKDIIGRDFLSDSFDTDKDGKIVDIFMIERGTKEEVIDAVNRLFERINRVDGKGEVLPPLPIYYDQKPTKIQ